MIKIYGIVYCATNTVNQKKYIGQSTRTLDLRKNEHIWKAERGHGYAFHQAIRKYGADKFDWSVLDSAENQDELNEKEEYWIKLYNCFYTGGYNMATGGQSNLSENPDELSLMRGGKEFLVFDLEGNYVKTAISQKQFAVDNGLDIGFTNEILHDRKPSVNGYILIFKNEFTEELLNNKIKRCKTRPFYVFDNRDMSYVGKWNDMKQCAGELKLSRETISKKLKNGNIKKFNHINYLFYYLDALPENLKGVIN